MSLYLCVFSGEQEIEGVEVGGYADYNSLRQYIAQELEGGVAGSRFPAFMLHSDCDGEWSVEECGRLRSELTSISAALKGLPPVATDESQTATCPTNAFESFVDVDGQILLERLQSLVEIALQNQRPILFQ